MIKSKALLQAEKDYNSLFDSRPKIITPDLIFHVIKLIQGGCAEIELLQSGYDQTLLNKCREIMSYLFVCFKNQQKGVHV